MDWFRICKDAYESGTYTKDNVKIFVVKNKITAAQYKEITGDDYVA
jgi:uncharacterized XkdX family phage protein